MKGLAKSVPSFQLVQLVHEILVDHGLRHVPEVQLVQAIQCLPVVPCLLEVQLYLGLPGICKSKWICFIL